MNNLPANVLQPCCSRYSHFPGRNGLKSGRLVAQRGAALIVSLVILLLMTIIGITSMSTNSMEEKMAGNMRDRNLAFQAAEAALRDGEALLAPPAVVPTPCNDPPCLMVASGDFLTLGAAWWMASAREFGVAGVADIAGASQDPRYVIEVADQDSDDLGLGGLKTGRDYYRVTARGLGGAATTQVILQSTYVRAY